MEQAVAKFFQSVAGRKATKTLVIWLSVEQNHHLSKLRSGLALQLDLQDIIYRPTTFPGQALKFSQVLNYQENVRGLRCARGFHSDCSIYRERMWLLLLLLL
jgi:hypothetical protein